MLRNHRQLIPPQSGESVGSPRESVQSSLLLQTVVQS